ncbi:MAG TPA: acetyl-CoA carboxylase biotin carboxyl carrier protein [Roseiflexaceae bacterium]
MAEGAGKRRDHAPDDDFGLSALREVLRLISETDITEITIERGGSKLHIRRGASQAQSAAAPFLVTPSLAAALPHAMHSPLPPVAPFQQHAGPHPAGEPAQADETSEHMSGDEPIASPMVGTYYSAPSPKDPPYVQEGDTIQPGDRVGIVEAMKMMNEIEAEIGGRITKILVKDGQPVEYGQPLMIVEPL